jgi:hypothetical protein
LHYRGFFKLTANVLQLAEVAIFTTNVDAENQTFINHKCVCGALNRHFCQTAVSSWLLVCPFVLWSQKVNITFNFFCRPSQFW